MSRTTIVKGIPMKATAIALIIALAIPIAWAQAPQQRWITTPEGEITLQAEPCRQGGKEAVFIARSGVGGAGAYGCWHVQGDQIVIVWHTLIGVNGSALQANFTQTFPNR